jgi:polyisoprenoid-binding protein YceI
MKTVKNTILLMVVILTAAACGSPNLGEKAEVTDAQDVSGISGDVQVFMVSSENSTLEWVGSKPTGTHDGSLKIKSGELFVQNGAVVGGNFTLDMTSIVNYDIEDPGMNAKLVGHLHSDDFFSTKTHPEGHFEITDAQVFEGTVAEGESKPTHTIAGNLTIKDITRNIRFNAIVNIDDAGIFAETIPFVINRAEYDIRFKSRSFFDNLKDDFIHDDIGLRIRLEAMPQG